MEHDTPGLPEPWHPLFIEGKLDFSPRFPGVVRSLLPSDETVQIKPMYQAEDVVSYEFQIDNGRAEYDLQVTEDQYSIHFEAPVARVIDPTTDFLADLHIFNNELGVGKVSMASESLTDEDDQLGSKRYRVLYGLNVPKQGVPTRTIAAEFLAFDDGISEVSRQVRKRADLGESTISEDVRIRQKRLARRTLRLLGLVSGEEGED